MTFDNTEVELRVGEALNVGRYRVTVVEIDGDEVVFQVEDSTTSDRPTTIKRPR